MEAISRNTIQEIAAEHAIDPMQLTQWKLLLLASPGELLIRTKNYKGKEQAGPAPDETAGCHRPRAEQHAKP